ncbi:MAG: hypothetical protein KDJ65_37450 [Anaerolineae bacterium]|nr:hypothetical protein [Anaerolineae bacterium]
MLSPEVHYMVSREQHKDRLRRFEQDQQFLDIEPDQIITNPTQYQKAANWLGDQMIKWGTRLQSL